MDGEASRDVALREARERRAFETIAKEGRSAASDADLVIAPRDLQRLLGAELPTADPLEQMFAWAKPLAGARVLEICCHDGEYGVVLARGGAQVTSVDLCPELVDIARRRIDRNGVGDRMSAEVMSVHDLALPDGHFDIVFGKASLHHLDLQLAKSEIFRVLRPGGRGIFAEPVSLSPTLQAIRERIPIEPDKESPDERQLDEFDLMSFERGFVETERAYFRLFSRLGRIHPALYRAFARADRALLDRFEGLRRYAAICVFSVRKPVERPA